MRTGIKLTLSISRLLFPATFDLVACICYKAAASMTILCDSSEKEEIQTVSTADYFPHNTDLPYIFLHSLAQGPTDSVHISANRHHMSEKRPVRRPWKIQHGEQEPISKNTHVVVIPRACRGWKLICPPG